MKYIIGITGKTGCGKDVFTRHIEKNFDKVTSLRFSTPLTQGLSIFVDEILKQDQQWFGTVLRERFGNDILIKAIEKKIAGIGEGIIVLNGLRYPVEFDFVKKIGGKIIFVDVDSKIRYERIQGRKEKKDDKSTYEEFLEKDNAKTESFLDELKKESDFIVDNNGSIKEFKNKIKETLKCIMGNS